MASTPRAADAARILALLATYEARGGEVIQRSINGQIVTSTEANQLMGPAKEVMRQADPLVEALATALESDAAIRVSRVGDQAGSLLWVILGAVGTTPIVDLSQPTGIRWTSTIAASTLASQEPGR